MFPSCSSRKPRWRVTRGVQAADGSGAVISARSRTRRSPALREGRRDAPFRRAARVLSGAVDREDRGRRRTGWRDRPDTRGTGDARGRRGFGVPPKYAQNSSYGPGSVGTGRMLSCVFTTRSMSAFSRSRLPGQRLEHPREDFVEVGDRREPLDPEASRSTAFIAARVAGSGRERELHPREALEVDRRRPLGRPPPGRWSSRDPKSRGRGPSSMPPHRRRIYASGAAAPATPHRSQLGPLVVELVAGADRVVEGERQQAAGDGGEARDDVGRAQAVAR